jgi:hypothetical protein
MYTKYCSECREELPAYCRIDQTTCIPKCRKARERRQKQARLALPLAMYELGKIRDSIKRHERVPDFINDLKRLKAEINDLLLLAGDTESMERREMIESIARKRY